MKVQLLLSCTLGSHLQCHMYNQYPKKGRMWGFWFFFKIHSPHTRNIALCVFWGCMGPRWVPWNLGLGSYGRLGPERHKKSIFRPFGR